MLFSNRVLFIALISLQFFSTTAISQALWSDIREENIQAAPEDRQIIPNQYRTLRLDFEKMKAFLLTAPGEQEFLAGEEGLLLDFPMPDGGFARFEIWEAPVMAPELTAQFPDIRSFAGRDVDRSGMIARFDISPNGFHGMVLNAPGSTVFIDPYARGNTADYLCYFRKDFVKHDGSTFICHVSDSEVVELNDIPATSRAGTCGNRRVFRLALACTGEYANFHGAYGTNKAPALAAMNTSMTRVNGVFERDASIEMIMVANDTSVIFTDPNTDPYTNSDGTAMLSQNQTTCDNIIGSANYDIGHVFSTGGGGIAQLSSPCSSGNKAKGVTGLPSPIGDPFDIDYVAHEMGHQYGGQHTQYNDNCNRSNTSAMEPGSASTIMGYAGVCDPNIQPHSDDYYHARSLQQFATFLASGGTCAVLVSTGNSAPVVPTLTNRSIPKGTPFVLSGSATDPNGDPLTFCWEQMDAWSGGTQPMPPQSTNANGPVFRSLSPVTVGSRYFPNFDDELAGITPTWEVLPSIGRSLSFRLTVRDNHSGGGCTSEQNMTVTTSDSIGPFQVTAPNGGESYPVGSQQTIQWNVAGSTGTPVSCTSVNILLSTDGGASFSTLLANTPNDGTQPVTIPGPVTNAARILIQALGNIFYDVSDNNFQIVQALPVELVAFNASSRGKTVQLDWSTASEKNNKGFSIERSAGNTSDFQAIGWIDGQGTTSAQHDYRFVDSGVRSGSILYYRLRQTDFDGQMRYSDIRAVTLDGAGGMLSFSPNPAREQVSVQFPGFSPREAVQAYIQNTAGGVVAEQLLLPGAATLDVRGLEPGLYVVRISAENRVFHGKFFKN